MGGSAFSDEADHENDRRPAAFQTLYTSGYRVELAATTLGPGLPGMQAFHTSVTVDDVEYSFSFEGITHGPDLLSHKHLPNAPAKLTYMGLTAISGKQMLSALKPHFQRGTYDLLRKNCNSFSDCALFFLLDARLDPSYRGLEQIGHAADKNAGVVQKLSGGDYKPNAKADDFRLEKVIKEVNKDKSSPSFGLR